MLQQFNTTVQDNYVLIPSSTARFSLLSIPKLLAFFAFTALCLFSTLSPVQAQSGSGSVIEDLGGRMAPQIQPTTVWGQFILDAQSTNDPVVQLQILDNKQQMVFLMVITAWVFCRKKLTKSQDILYPSTMKLIMR